MSAPLTMAASASHSNLRVNRIKRKPPPVVDIAERYPPPDPNDPWAPLWVLRSRSSNAQFQMSSQEDLHASKPAYTIYPSPPISPTPPDYLEPQFNPYVLDSDLPKPRPLMHHPNPSRESHYRKRSQSIAFMPSPPPTAYSPYGYWNLTPSTPPGLVRDDTDSGTDSDRESFPRPDRPTCHSVSSTSRSRLAQFFLPRRSSATNLGSRPRTASPPRKRINKLSISHPLQNASSDVLPMPSPAHLHNQNSDHSHLRKSFFVPQHQFRPHTTEAVFSTDAGYFSQPETSSITVLSRDRSASFAPFTNHTISPSTPSSESHASSYVHVSPPSSSASYSNSHSHSHSHADFVFPRRVHYPPQSNHVSIPRPTTSSFSSPTKSRLPSRRPASKPKTPVPRSSTPSPEWSLPTLSQLSNAAAHTLVAQNGLRISFGALFAHQRTITIFIRHFWCPHCQDYMSDLVHSVDPAALAAAGVRLIVIGNGAPGMIAKYRQIFGAPFEVYVDPEMRVYDALGMGTVDKEREGEERGRQRERREWGSGYAKHGTMSGVAMVVLRALKVGMPVWEKGGDAAQLGGEFVLGPGLACTYAHRMQTTRGHIPVLDVIKSVGIDLPEHRRRPDLPSHPASSTLFCCHTRGEGSVGTSSSRSRSRVSREQTRATLGGVYGPGAAATTGEATFLDREKRRSFTLGPSRGRNTVVFGMAGSLSAGAAVCLADAGVYGGCVPDESRREEKGDTRKVDSLEGDYEGPVQKQTESRDGDGDEKSSHAGADADAESSTQVVSEQEHELAASLETQHTPPKEEKEAQELPLPPIPDSDSEATFVSGGDPEREQEQGKEDDVAAAPMSFYSTSSETDAMADGYGYESALSSPSTEEADVELGDQKLDVPGKAELEVQLPGGEQAVVTCV